MEENTELKSRVADLEKSLSKLKVDFMGDVDYFLGTAFTWQYHVNDHVSVHLTQTNFTELTAQ